MGELFVAEDERLHTWFCDRWCHIPLFFYISVKPSDDTRHHIWWVDRDVSAGIVVMRRDSRARSLSSNPGDSGRQFCLNRIVGLELRPRPRLLSGNSIVHLSSPAVMATSLSDTWTGLACVHDQLFSKPVNTSGIHPTPAAEEFHSTFSRNSPNKRWPAC